MEFNEDQYKQYYLDYDVTNYNEVAGMTILIFLNILLLSRLMFNFRAIMRWYLQNEEVDPKKLICINSILLISVIIRLISENYSLWGCVFSDFFRFIEKPSLETKYVYNNIMVYSILEQFYVQFQNLAMLVASKFWLSVIQAKYLYQQNVSFRQEVQGNTEIGKPTTSMSQSFAQQKVSIIPLSTQLKLLKICSYALKASWVIIIIATISSCIFLTQNKNNDFENFDSYLIITTTILSGVAFSLSCLIIYFDLEAFYTVDPKYKERVIIFNIKKEQMRKAALFLVLTQIIRFSFNSVKIFDENSLNKIKSGKDDITFPDDGYYWAIIVPTYSFVVDFIPTFFLSELFSPLPNSLKQVHSQCPDDTWDVKSIS